MNTRDWTVSVGLHASLLGAALLAGNTSPTPVLRLDPLQLASLVAAPPTPAPAAAPAAPVRRQVAPQVTPHPTPRSASPRPPPTHPPPPAAAPAPRPAESATPSVPDPVATGRPPAVPTAAAPTTPPSAQTSTPTSAANTAANTATTMATTTPPATTAAAAPTATATPPRPDPGRERRWQAALEALLTRDRHYPAAARRARQEGVVLVEAQFDDHGALLRCAIHASSGFRSLDEAALAMVRRAAEAVRADHAPGRVALLHIPITFQLEES